MPNPARAGAVVYAKDLQRMARFYQALLQAQTLHEAPDHVLLQSDGLQLVVHAIPAHIAATITVTTPPEPREDQAIKLFFPVPGIDWARAAARAAGGDLGGRPWAGPGFVACDGTDPEGNVFQVRAAAGAAPAAA